jgi:hypothetical protein
VNEIPEKAQRHEIDRQDEQSAESGAVSEAAMPNMANALTKEASKLDTRTK